MCQTLGPHLYVHSSMRGTSHTIWLYLRSGRIHRLLTGLPLNKTPNLHTCTCTCGSEPMRDFQCVTIWISILRAASSTSGQLSGISLKMKSENILVTWCRQLGKLVMMFWREVNAVRTSSWSMWIVSRERRSMRSSRVISAGMIRGIAAMQVLRRSSLGFTGLRRRE